MTDIIINMTDYTANTQNSEGTYDFNANYTDFDTTASVNSNGETDGVSSQYDLNTNAAAALKGILCNQKSRKSSINPTNPSRVLTKSSKIPTRAVAKMMANKQDRVVNRQGKAKRLVTYAATITNIDYSYCDSLVSEDQPVKDIHYKVNLSNMIVGRKHLALCDSGMNGLIIGRYMKIIYFNSDGMCVSIEIAADYQLAGNRLYTDVTMAKSNIEWTKLIWCQGAQVKSQKNSKPWMHCQ